MNRHIRTLGARVPPIARVCTPTTTQATTTRDAGERGDDDDDDDDDATTTTMDGALDDEVGLPKATLSKMINEALGGGGDLGGGSSGGLRMANDCRDAVIECCTEFINAVSAESNELSTKDGKTTITAEYVLAALRALGFESYEAECTIARDEHKEEETHKRETKKKKKNIGLSAEEAIAMQQELFAKAKARMEGGEGDSAPAPGGVLGSLG